MSPLALHASNWSMFLLSISLKKIILKEIPTMYFFCVDIVMWTMLVWTFSFLIFNFIVVVLNIVIVFIVNSPLNFITLKTSEPFISLDSCFKEDFRENPTL